MCETSDDSAPRGMCVVPGSPDRGWRCRPPGHADSGRRTRVRRATRGEGSPGSPPLEHVQKTSP